MARGKHFSKAGNRIKCRLDVAYLSSKSASDNALLNFALSHELTTASLCNYCQKKHQSFETMKKCLIKLYKKQNSKI